MPLHDWTQVPAGIVHAFHQRWISAICDLLNESLLPKELYALAEQVAGESIPDVLTLQSGDVAENANGNVALLSGSQLGLQTRPTTRIIQESDSAYTRRKQNQIVIRHVSGDQVVAVLEIISPGNKSSENALESLLKKVCEYLEHRVHLLILDPFPPGRRDPQGLHGLIWDRLCGEEFVLPADKPLTLVAYECDQLVRAYVEPMAIGDPLPDMPLFIVPNGCIMIPLELTYQTAFSKQPLRWRTVLEPG